jgi:hypothetical protein
LSLASVAPPVVVIIEASAPATEFEAMVYPMRG